MALRLVYAGAKEAMIALRLFGLRPILDVQW